MDKGCLSISVVVDTPAEFSNSTKPSYQVTFDELTPSSYQIYGLLCRRSPTGAPASNLPPTDMAFVVTRPHWGDCSVASRRFALEILRPFLQIRSPSSEGRHKSLRRLTTAFTEDILSTMPYCGGCIPKSEIELWLRIQTGDETADFFD